MKTIKDIANEAGVSAGTVDRVLHNRTGVSKKTKEKIEKILKKYNFQKNIIASTLAFKKQFKVVTLIPFSQSKKDFWHQPKQGIELAISEIRNYGFDVDAIYFEKLNEQSFVEAYNKVLNLKPDGVVFTSFFGKKSKDFAIELDKKSIPYLLINIEKRDLNNISFIGQDNMKSGYLSGKLLNLTLKKDESILIVRSIKNINRNEAIEYRIKGFKNFFKEKNQSREIIEVDIKDITDGQDLRDVLKTEFNKNSKVKGVFVPSSGAYMVANIISNHLQNNDIRLLGFDLHKDNLKYLLEEKIDFLIDQNPFEQGYLGLKILFEFLLFNRKPEKKYSSPINIVTKENLEYFRNVTAYKPIVS